MISEVRRRKKRGRGCRRNEDEENMEKMKKVVGREASKAIVGQRITTTSAQIPLLFYFRRITEVDFDGDDAKNETRIMRKVKSFWLLCFTSY